MLMSVSKIRMRLTLFETISLLRGSLLTPHLLHASVVPPLSLQLYLQMREPTHSGPFLLPTLDESGGNIGPDFIPLLLEQSA